MLTLMPDLIDLFTEPDTRVRQRPPGRDVRAEYRSLQPGSSPKSSIIEENIIDL